MLLFYEHKNNSPAFNTLNFNMEINGYCDGCTLGLVLIMWTAINDEKFHFNIHL